jgi:hypothetical protein
MSTVVVACKYPCGIKLSENVTVWGSAVDLSVGPTVPMVGGYALSYGIDADLWNAWLERNRDSALVTNKLIFAHESPAICKQMAQENARVRSGMEPAH